LREALLRWWEAGLGEVVELYERGHWRTWMLDGFVEDGRELLVVKAQNGHRGFSAR
jgi:hypothetical protein